MDESTVLFQSLIDQELVDTGRMSETVATTMETIRDRTIRYLAANQESLNDDMFIIGIQILGASNPQTMIELIQNHFKNKIDISDIAA